MMPRFRKKPVEIEARQLPAYFGLVSDAGMVCAWSGAEDHFKENPPYAIIHTLEGDHRADPEDWIIQGVAGEFYPCKPDIFAATYEPVT